VTNISPTPLHELPASLDVAAMVVAAAFGVHAARTMHIPLFGVLLAGVIAGLGGGMARDVVRPRTGRHHHVVLHPRRQAAAIVGGLTARRVSLDGAGDCGGGRGHRFDPS